MKLGESVPGRLMQYPLRLVITGAVTKPASSPKNLRLFIAGQDTALTFSCQDWLYSSTPLAQIFLALSRRDCRQSGPLKAGFTGWSRDI